MAEREVRCRYINDLNLQWRIIFWGGRTTIPLRKFLLRVRREGGFRTIVSPEMLLDYHRFRADSIASFAGDQVRIISEAREAA